jgi:tetratricopeptide (TPR) repeat protein
VRFWDALTLKPLGLPLVHPAPVVQLAFGADGKTFRAMIQDGSPFDHYRLRIWNAAELPDDLLRVQDWVRVLTGLSFDSRGRIRVLDRESWVKLHQRLGNQASLDLPGMEDAVSPLPEAWMSDDPAQGHRSRAERLRSEGKIEEEVEELREAIRLSPDDHVAHTALAVALRQLGRLDEALAECREALRLQPKYGWAMQVQGWILLGKADWDGAIAAYQEASQNGQRNEAPLYHDMGLAFLGKGLFDDAIAQFRVALERNPHYEPARESLSLALRDSGRFNEAVDEFRATIRRYPDDAMPHVHYCRSLIWAGRLEEAIAASREAVRLMPDFGPAWQVHADCLFQDRDWDGAIGAYREAIRHGPDNAGAHNELGIALRGRGRLDEALAEFRRALELVPGEPAISRELATTQRHQVLAPRLPAVLRGEDRPAKASEWLELADLCGNRNLHAAAARMVTEAFKADPALADDREASHRYNAARNAALAARGKGQDDPAPDQDARLRLLSLALGWLEAERTAWEPRLAAGSVVDRTWIVRMLNHWKHDPDLAGLRDAALVKTLPVSYQNACVAFWAKVDGMLERAIGKKP